MKSRLRRMRGAFGMGLTWALGWTPIGGLVEAVLWVLRWEACSVLSAEEARSLLGRGT